MTGPYDPPSVPEMKHPFINEAFGWDTSSEVPPSVKLGVSQAADTLAQMRAALNNNITETWANAAVTTDMLQGKLGYNIAGQLQGVANTTAGLQQPIAMQVLGPLSQAVETTVPLGIVPPMPGSEQNIPPAVQIRQAGLQGDIGPALEAYRLQAFPQRFTRGVQYSDVVNDITNALPADSGVREAFAAAVLNLQNQPDTIPVGPSGMVEGSGSMSGVGHPAWTSGMAPGSLPLPGGSDYGSGFTSNYHPVTLVAGGDSTTIVQGPSGPTITLGAPGLATPLVIGPSGQPLNTAGAPPGYFYPPGTNILVPIPAGSLTVPPGYIPGSGAGPAPTGPIPIGGPSGGPPGSLGGNATGSIPGSGAPPVGAPLPLAPTPVTTLPPGSPIPPGGMIGSGPPPGTYYPPPAPPGMPPPTGTVPGQPPKPETPTKPLPPPQQQPCIKICPPDAPPPKKCDYTAWCSAATGTLYVVRTDQPARGVSDVKLATGDPTEWNWPALQDQCGGTPGQQPAGGPGGVQPFQLPAACGEFGGAPGARVPGGDNNLAALLGLVNADGSLWQPFPNAGVTDIAQNVVNSLLTGVTYPLLQFAQIIQGVISGNPCYSGEMGGLLGGDATMGLAERWIGVDLSTFRIPNAYNRHFKCPVLIPTIPEAATAWLAGEIDEPTLQCWVAANNGRYPEISTAIRAARTKLAPLQYGALYMREKLTAQEFQDRLRATGMIRPTDRDDVLELLKQLPPASDLVRMMIRDVEDTVNIDWTTSDQIFLDKWKGQLQSWTEQQGVPEQYMRYLWRAHWSLPSPGQLADMLHRLSRLPPGDPAYVDMAKIRQTLLQQDIHPDWVDKFIATSYRPLTRIDARRAFENGALDDAGLIESYLNLGYNQQNAQTLLEFNKRQRLLKFLKSPHVKEYVTGELNGEQLDTMLRLEGATEEIVQSVHGQLPVAMDKLRRSRCLKALQRRYLQGDISQGDAQQAIQSQGLDADQVQSILAGWDCELQARGKAIPAGELCTMFGMGALTVPDLVQRLQRLGYDYDDAVLMARRCATTTQQKMNAADQKQLKQLQQQEKALERAVTRDAAQRARQMRQGQILAQKTQSLRVAREKRLLEAGEKLSKHFQGSLADSILAVKAVFNEFVSQTLYTWDEIINALVVVSGSKEVSDIPSLTAAVQTGLSGQLAQSNGELPATQQQTPTQPPRR